MIATSRMGMMLRQVHARWRLVHKLNKWSGTLALGGRRFHSSLNTWRLNPLSLVLEKKFLGESGVFI